jgi:hypothetical protein
MNEIAKLRAEKARLEAECADLEARLARALEYRRGQVAFIATVGGVGEDLVARAFELGWN